MNSEVVKTDNKKNTINSIVRIFTRCVGMIFSFNRFYFVFSICLTIIQGIIPVFSLIIMQEILNGLQERTMLVNRLFLLVFFYIMVELINSVLSTINNYFTTKVSVNFAKNLTVQLLNKATDLELRDYENSEIHNIINRAQNEGNEKIITFVNSFFLILQQVVTIASYITVLISFKIWIIGIILIVPIIRYLYSLYVNRVQFNVQKARTTKARKAWYFSYLITSGNAYKEIKLFNLRDFFINRYKQLTDEIIAQDLSILKRYSIISFLIIVIDEFISGAVFLYIVYGGIIGMIRIGNVVSYTKCIFNIQGSIQSILSLLTTISKNSLFVSLYFEFLDMESDYKGKFDNKNMISVDRIESIELKNVSYKFQGSNDYVLKNINLRINAGETIALVGRNGSGKTTLSKIMLGFYEEYRGDILINGVNIRSIDKDSLRAHMGCIFQDYMKYEASVRDNIAYGDLSQYNNDEKIKKILKMSCFNQEIINEEGLDTKLGFWFDHGKQVSMGEWQRIAIARAFIRGADFYVLDEPDASLDAESESEILRQYSSILEDKLGVFITHRLNNIKFLSNRIIVMDSGRIVEQGTHNELIRMGKNYYKLYGKLNEYSA